MLQTEFTLYRFVCDLETFTGLFTEDSEGRHIPDTAAFCCVWGRVPRSQITTLNPVQLEPSGGTGSTYFKSLSSDMALTFPLEPTSLLMNGDKEVLTFQIRPTQYNGGDIPVVAKGTLDPSPYFGKPRKNYAVKLRDASAQAIGKLIFNLAVTEVDVDDTEEVRRAARASQSAARHSQSGTPSRPPPPPRSSTVSRNPSLDRSPPRTSTAPTAVASPVAALEEASAPAKVSPPHRRDRDTRHSEEHNNGDSPLPKAPKETVHDEKQRRDEEMHRKKTTETHSKGKRSSSKESSPVLDAATAKAQVPQSRHTTTETPESPRGPATVESLHIVFERVAVKPEEVQLDRPSPFVIGAVYAVKLRHGTTSHGTANMTCTRGHEIPLLDQETRLPLLAGATEKLRFSLWENGKQVAGFSLATDKFRGALDHTKPYTIPFRYHPTNQMCTLDVTVTRTQTPLTTTTKPRREVVAAVAPTPVPAVMKSNTAPAPTPAAAAATAAARISPVKVLHRWGPTDTVPEPTGFAAARPTGRAPHVTAPAPGISSQPHERERSTSSPAPHPVPSATRSATQQATAAVGPSLATTPRPGAAPTRSSPLRVPASHHTQLRHGTTGAASSTSPSVADTAMELRVVEVNPTPAPVPTHGHFQSLTGFTAAPRPGGGPASGSGSVGGGTPLRQRADVTTDGAVAAFPVESLAVPRIIPESRRAHSRDPSSTALGLPSEPQHADPFAQGRGTPVRSFLPRTTSSRNNSLTGTPTNDDFPRGEPHTTSSRSGFRAAAASSFGEPDSAEHHMSSVLARLDAMREERNRTPLFDRNPATQSASGQPGSQPSLPAEWQQWRNSRPRSCSGDGASPYDPRRSPSVSSVLSRDDSIASVSSRRCSPLPTKSFAKQAELRPFQTLADDDALTRYRRNR